MICRLFASGHICIYTCWQIPILFSFLTFAAFGQNYQFDKDFANGTIFLKFIEDLFFDRAQKLNKWEQS
jgi:hypothetical protein